MDEKRKMQEILNHSLSGLQENPFLPQRVIAQAKGEEPMKKRISFSVIIIVAVLLIGTMTALAASVEDINAMLYKLWPEAARALRPLNLSDEGSGIRLDIISASLTDDQLLITYSLTDLEGDRLSEETELDPYAYNPTIDSKYSSNRLLYYDAENHQAVFASYWEYLPVSLPEGVVWGEDPGTITFRINGLMSPVKTGVDLWPLMADNAYPAEPASVPVANPGLETIVASEDAAKEAEKHIPEVLNPENNLHIAVVEGIELSGIGWIDGQMHVQVYMSDWLKSVGITNTARYTCFISLRDRQGNEVMWTDEFMDQLLKDNPYYIWGVNWRNGGEEQWIEKIFPVQPEDMDQYMIYCEIEDRLTKNEELLNSEWIVSFPVNMIQTE